MPTMLQAKYTSYSISLRQFFIRGVSVGAGSLAPIASLIAAAFSTRRESLARFRVPTRVESLDHFPSFTAPAEFLESGGDSAGYYRHLCFRLKNLPGGRPV
eukprot:GHVU01132782.1.p1 GENE.GHVU01132782.1~~GHVU01132782.1.p1  ORF type:complete len:101 (+),score=2.33 GHVU01132782.1:955-1257(+)